MSIAGGFSRVRERAEQLGCDTIQLFTRSPRGWRIPALDPKEVAQFRSGIKAAGIEPVFVHVPYLPNLAAGGKLGKDSVAAVVADCERAQALGISLVITHVGRGTGIAEPTALAHVAANLDSVLEHSPDAVTLLLENTAGMGSEVGYRFEQLAGIIGRVRKPDRVGVMLDTAHAFEAGYEMKTRAGLDATLREFDRVVGMGRLFGLHLNDSKTEFGSRVDRHWHIGEGCIGRAGMKLIIRHPLLSHLPAVMETPKKSEQDDRMNMRAARSLAR